MTDHRSDGDDLDDLLDSALDDFQSLNLNSRSADSAVQGLGKGLPDLRIKKKGKAKESAVSEALDKLREQTREAVKGLDSVTSPAEPNMEDWVKQFEELASSQDMESIMETMMQQLLSKEILHEPMKEIGEKYPKWLADHEASVSKEEYGRFSQQYELIKALNVVYEKEPNNFNKIVELMQKMQDCGQPPSDILTDLSPDFDLSAFSQMSPETLGSEPNCCIM